MRIPEQVIGYVLFEDVEYPFLYDDAVVKLFPPDKKTWDTNRWAFFKNFDNLTKQDKWIESLNLNGITSEGYNILFVVSESSSSYNGFLSFEVYYAIMYDSTMATLESFDGFKLAGTEIDYFFPPYQTFQSHVTFDESGAIKNMAVECPDIPSLDCGNFTIEKESAHIVISALPTHHHGSSRPFSSKSEMVITFSQKSSYNTVLESVHTIGNFFRYVTRRQNIKIDSISLFVLNDGKRHSCGNVIINEPKNYPEETHKDKEKRIIKGSILNDRTGALLTSIGKSEIYLEHLCDSINKTRSYDISRQILIFGAFEREFRNIYGENYGRSTEYIDTKKKIVYELESYGKKYTGKRKEYVNQIKRIISKLDIRLSDKLIAACKDCSEIMDPFISYIYHSEYDQAIETMASRMNELRNNATHANLGYEIDPIHLMDYKVVQILLYAMRLHQLGIETKNAQQGIADLFGIPLTLN